MRGPEKQILYRIITIEREYGTGAAEIASKLSAQLGWTLWDRELTEEIARVAHVDPRSVSVCEERVDRGFQRLVKVFWRGSYERRADMEHLPFGPDRLVEVGEQVMRDLAERGKCVIVGRCADYILESWKAFDVFVHAPIEDRVERVRRLYPAWDDRITDHIRRIDECRADYYHHFTNRAWGQASNYALSLDSSRFGVDGCVNIIAKVVES